jgi:hypothetical protein
MFPDFTMIYQIFLKSPSRFTCHLLPNIKAVYFPHLDFPEEEPGYSRLHHTKPRKAFKKGVLITIPSFRTICS